MCEGHEAPHWREQYRQERRRSTAQRVWQACRARVPPFRDPCYHWRPNPITMDQRRKPDMFDL